MPTVSEDHHRDWLVQAHHAASESFDKAIMTLSGGALGISIAFVRDIAPQPKATPVLEIAWGLFAASLLLILVSFETSKRTLLKEIEARDARRELSRSEFYGVATEWLTWGAGGAFVIGTALVVFFAMYNL